MLQHALLRFLLTLTVAAPIGPRGNWQRWYEKAGPPAGRFKIPIDALD
jgi:hypothetical protein